MKRDPGRDRWFPVQNFRSVRIIAACLPAILGGCHALNTPTVPAQPPGLNWLTQFVPGESDVAPMIAVEQLRSPEAAAVVHGGDLLELTVWDLYEPGIPHTSPLRINGDGSADPPLLADVQLEGLTLGEAEKLLIDKYQRADLLLQPRVMVRRLETASCSVQILGGVEREGVVKLPQDQATVYHAVLAAGGLKKYTSANWMLTRYPRPVASTTRDDGALKSAEGELPESPSEEGTVVSTLETSELRTPIEERTFDLSKPQELQELKRISLQEGDVLRIPESSPPVRITGVVRKPGNYPMHASQSLTIREAIDLSGGLLLPTLAGQAVVTRPIPGGVNVERWSFPIVKGEVDETAPDLRPGDSLHVEVSPHEQVKRVLGGLRPHVPSRGAEKESEHHSGEDES